MGRLAELADSLLFPTDDAAAPAPFPDACALAEGRALLDVFFAGTWCDRRVVILQFLAERRGQWTVSVDFLIDGRFAAIESLRRDEEILVPLFTFSKEIMPRAHVRTKDERGHGVSMAGTRRSRRIACMMLMVLAADAGIWQHAVPLLADLTDADPRVAGPAFTALTELLPEHTSKVDWEVPGAGLASRGEQLAAFASAARLFHRSVILLAAFEAPDEGRTKRKIVTFTYDAPVRLARYLPEFVGYSPLRVAPLILFGGDSRSYHVQLEPPDGVVVVDTRLLYSYTALEAQTPQRSFSEDQPDVVLEDARTRVPVARLLSRVGLHTYGSAPELRVRPVPGCALEAKWRRWWGSVEGSAEPMSAHVRIAARRLPALRKGRDAIAMFQLYPDIAAFAGLFVGAALNYAFILALFLSLQRLAVLIPATWLRTPEPLFIIGGLIAGFSSGLALYRREHIITGQVARPWRVLFATQVAAVIVSLVALLDSLNRSAVTHGTSSTVRDTFVVASLSIGYLMLISLRAWVAQRAGGRVFYGWQGAASRRRRFRRRCYRDHLGVPGQGAQGYGTRARLEPRSAEPGLSNRGIRRANRILRSVAESYLNEDVRRRLFNQGIPAASRHDPSSRGSSRS